MASQDPDSWMWARAREMLERAEKLQRQFFELRRSRSLRPTWEPPVDIFTTDAEIWILVALPGVEPEKLEIIVDGEILGIRGERSLPPECRHANVQRLEIPSGQFERRIELPRGQMELCSSELRNGCLLLTLKRRG